MVWKTSRESFFSTINAGLSYFLKMLYETKCHLFFVYTLKWWKSKDFFYISSKFVNFFGHDKKIIIFSEQKNYPLMNFLPIGITLITKKSKNLSRENFPSKIIR